MKQYNRQEQRVKQIIKKLGARRQEMAPEVSIESFLSSHIFMVNIVYAYLMGEDLKKTAIDSIAESIIVVGGLE
jgi:hypothetical protein